MVASSSLAPCLLENGAAGTEAGAPGAGLSELEAGALGGLVASQIAVQHPGAHAVRWSPWPLRPVLAPMATGPGSKAEVLSGISAAAEPEISSAPVERFSGACKRWDGKALVRMPGR